MEIRKVVAADDARQIAEVYVQSWKAAYAGILPQSYLDALDTRQWTPNLSAQSNTHYVLIENGEYIGTSAIAPARDPKMEGCGEIISIYLRPEFFGKGYGKALLDTVVHALTSSQFSCIYLWVLEDNHRARRFYEKNGFRWQGESKRIEIAGLVLTELRYTYNCLQKKG